MTNCLTFKAFITATNFFNVCIICLKDDREGYDLQGNLQCVMRTFCFVFVSIMPIRWQSMLQKTHTHTHRERCILNVCVPYWLTDQLSFLLFLLITCLQRLFVLPVAYFQFGCVCVYMHSPYFSSCQTSRQTNRQANK